MLHWLGWLLISAKFFSAPSLARFLLWMDESLGVTIPHLGHFLWPSCLSTASSAWSHWTCLGMGTGLTYASVHMHLSIVDTALTDEELSFVRVCFLYQFTRAAMRKSITGWAAYTTGINFITTLEVRSSKSSCWKGSFLLRPLSSALMAIFSLCFHNVFSQYLSVTKFLLLIRTLILLDSSPP